MQPLSQTFSLDGRVLIVDDEANVRLMLQRSLVRLEPGLEVQVADSSAQALEFLRGQPFDLVVTDYQMPRMNGLELIQAIRRGYPTTKIILMTAYPSQQLTEQLDRLAVDGYLAKPFSTRRLHAIVRDLLPDRSFLSCR